MACWEPFIADISISPYTYAPKDYAFCNGSMLSIAQNQALFALIGTLYGGNGVNIFQLPDLRGRVPLGAGNSMGAYYALGDTGGAASITPATVKTEMPEGESPTIQAAAPGAIQILPPYQVLNYIIALYGVWPSRP